MEVPAQRGRMDRARVAVLSDDRLFCDGIIGILRSNPAYTVSVVEGGDAALHDGNVDVLLIDSRLDRAFELCAASVPAAAVLIGAPPNDEWCAKALFAGASGVLPKNCGAHELLHAVRVVLDGSIWAPRRVMSACIRHLASKGASRTGGEAGLEQHLSRREREIFHQAAAGLANKELALRFAIGEATVKAHLTSIFQKLGVRGRAELAAVYHGVAPLPVVRRKSDLLTAGRAKK
jgi:DNA-binding NarL/FixJ family response regulator